jgi:molybdate transport system ATP-binding protein
LRVDSHPREFQVAREVTPMKWDVAVRKTMGADAHRFALDVSFVSDASRLVLFGPSGAGKSLTLKAVAGLLRPDTGHVRSNGRTLFDAAAKINIPAEERRLGYLFQEYALFPHLTVRQNVAFGSQTGWRNPVGEVRSEAVDRWMTAFELGGLAKRFPDQLSGGQRQRTALARALVANPQALLLDEPFAALDAPLRSRLRGELTELQAISGLPMILITHDNADVDAFAEQVVHIEAGRPVTVPPNFEMDSA